MGEKLAIQPTSERCFANAAGQDAGATEKYSLLFHDPLVTVIEDSAVAKANPIDTIGSLFNLKYTESHIPDSQTSLSTTQGRNLPVLPIQSTVNQPDLAIGYIAIARLVGYIII